MGQITTWTPETKQKFTVWLQAPTTWAVIFNPGGRVTITTGPAKTDKPLRYLVLRTSSGFTLHDPPDLPQTATDPDAPDPNEEFSATTESGWSMWDAGLPTDRLLDVAKDSVRTNDDTALLAEVERLAFNLSVARLCGWISDLLADPNPLAELWAVAFAFSMSQTQGITIGHKADQLGITKAALSKRVKAAQARFGLHSRGKSSAAADSYSEHLLEDRLK